MYYSSWKPATDIFRMGKQWLIRMELAGVSPEDVRIEVRRQELLVHGRRRDLFLQTGFVCQSLEITYSNFERTIRLPGAIDTDSIESRFTNGMLTIVLGTL